MVKTTDIKDRKTVIEDATNNLLNSEKVLAQIKVKLEDGKKLTPDETELLMAILDSELEEIKSLKLQFIRLYKPYKDK